MSSRLSLNISVLPFPDLLSMSWTVLQYCLPAGRLADEPARPAA